MIKRTMPTKERGELDPRFIEDPFEELRTNGKVRIEPRSKSQKKRFEIQDEERHYERD